MYEIAMSLAKTYHVPLWDVYMTHLEFLFESQYVCQLLSIFCNSGEDVLVSCCSCYCRFLTVFLSKQ